VYLLSNSLNTRNVEEDRLMELLLNVLTLEISDSEVDELVALAKENSKVKELVQWTLDSEQIRKELKQWRSIDTDAAYQKWRRRHKKPRFIRYRRL